MDKNFFHFILLIVFLNLLNTSSCEEWSDNDFVSPSSSLSTSSSWYNISFNPKGMDHLYMLSEYVIDFIQSDGLHPSLLKYDLFTNTRQFIGRNRIRILSHFWGIILTSTIALCFAIIVPVLGLLLCCCWCSKKTKHAKDDNMYTNASPGNGKKKLKYKIEKNCDGFHRSLSGVIMFIILLFMSFFVICAFVTNEYIKNGAKKLPITFNQSFDEIGMYLNNTQNEVDILLRTNFQQLQQDLNSNLDKSGFIIQHRLAIYSRAIALDNLTQIVTKLNTIHDDLVKLSNQVGVLVNHLEKLRIVLQNIRIDLENVFRDCHHPICDDLKRRYGPRMNQFRVSIQIFDLPDLEPLILNISMLINAGIIDEIQKGKSAFDEISGKIQSSVNNTIPEIKSQIFFIGEDLNRAKEDINEALKIPLSDIGFCKSSMYNVSLLIGKYEVYRWYGGLIGASCVLLILSLYTFGLLCGACKTQPTLQDYRNRRYKPPSTCPLKCGIILVFLMFGVLLLFTIGLFIIGILSDKVGCYLLENPSEPSTKALASILQQHFLDKDIAHTIKIIKGVKPNIADVISKCHRNSSLYHALQLSKYNRIQIGPNKIIDGFNITRVIEFKDRYKIEKRLKKFLESVNVNPTPIVILTKEGKHLLQRLRDTSLGKFNFTAFANLRYQRVTPLDLLNVSRELSLESSALPPSQLNYSLKIDDIVIRLKGYHHRFLADIQESLVSLNEGAQNIERQAQFGGKDLRDALTDLLHQASEAQNFIENNGKNATRLVAESFVRDLNSLIDQYINYVIFEVENRLGRCEAVSRAYNASTVALCKEIVLPFNGYWFSMASSLFLFLPATIFASILSRLFRKLKNSNKRRHPISDSTLTLENLEDDDIPLAHVVNKHEIHAPYDSRRNPSMYLDSSSSAPSAPLSVPEDNWSPRAPPSHLYTRPPPYNFHN